MPIIIFRGRNSISKKRIINHLVYGLHYKYCNLNRNSIDNERDMILKKHQWISKLINEGNMMLINGAFMKKESISFLLENLKLASSLTYLLVRTNEDELNGSIDKFKHEIIVKSDVEFETKMSENLHIIAHTLIPVEYYIQQIIEFPQKELTEAFLKKNPDFKETTSYLLFSKPIQGFIAMIIEILKQYYICEDKDASIKLVLELVKFVKQVGFSMRVGAKFYRVCNYDETANYTHLDQIWYPKSSQKKTRVSSNEPILYISDDWHAAYTEVFSVSVAKRPFIVLEVEVVKSFRINYNAPLNFGSQGGASKNKMYNDYCRDCRKIEPKLLALKEEMLRVFLGEFWIYKRDFHKIFTYDFVANISRLLLNRWQDTGLGYLSTTCDYGYNSFAIPAKVADECLQPGRVIILEAELLRNGLNLSFKFQKLKEGYVNKQTKEIDLHESDTNQL